MVEGVASLGTVDREEGDGASIVQVDHGLNVVRPRGLAERLGPYAPILLTPGQQGRRMRRGNVLGAAAASLCLLLGAAACGGDEGDSEAEIVDDLSEQLQSGAEDFDEETADCFAEIVVEDVGVEELQDIDFREEPPEEIQDEIAAATLRAAEECEVPG